MALVPIVPVAGYDAVYRPQNGDSANAEDMASSTWQPFANRDAYLKDAIDNEVLLRKQVCVYEISPVAKTEAPGDSVFELSELHNPESAYSISAYQGGHRVLFPTA